MSKAVQYITNEQGERVGVLLDLNTYSQLSQPSELDEECLVGLSVDDVFSAHLEDIHPIAATRSPIAGNITLKRLRSFDSQCLINRSFHYLL